MNDKTYTVSRFQTLNIFNNSVWLVCVMRSINNWDSQTRASVDTTERIGRDALICGRPLLTVSSGNSTICCSKAISIDRNIEENEKWSRCISSYPFRSGSQCIYLWTLFCIFSNSWTLKIVEAWSRPSGPMAMKATVFDQHYGDCLLAPSKPHFSMGNGYR